MISANLKKNDSAVTVGASSDEFLWLSFKGGNELAFTVLYKKYVQKLYDYGMHASHDENLVKDCLQDLFFRLWNKREGIASVQLVRPYLFTSFRRLLIERITSKRKEVVFSSWHERSFEFDPSIESHIIDRERNVDRHLQLTRCLELLTKRQREIIYLKFYNDLSYQEISVITEMQVSSVYNLVSKTIELFRKKMQLVRPLKPVR
jgi:RNA polymerase sigma factor (sigma-70 family)